MLVLQGVGLNLSAKAILDGGKDATEYWACAKRGDSLAKTLIGKVALVGTAALSCTSAVAQDLAVDPQGSGVITNAMRWIQGTLLGSFATAAAVIAIAVVGFLMLSGRINWRHGAIVILGCFILFGAASIVAGIQATATLGEGP
jgi:type IV secretion system protein VirB2